MSWVEDLRHDVVHALRAFAKAPGFAAATIATLALGIGATSAIATVVQALLLKPLPYVMGDGQLVRLVAHTPPPAGSTAPPRRGDVGFSAGEARELGARTRSLTGVGMVGSTVMGLRGVEGAGHVTVGVVTPEVFALLGASPALGRALVAADWASSLDLALVSHQAWQRHFEGDPSIIGRALAFETVLGRRTSRSLVVVGVMPPSFAFPSAQTAFWIPAPGASSGGAAFRGRLLARLAPGLSLGAALAELDPLVRAIRQHDPDVRYELVREEDELVAPVRPAVLVLAAAVGVLLVIACLNVANLLLARTLARRRELAVRAAVGASRGRLARQCLAEGAVLGALGGLAGGAVAYGGVQGFRWLATSLPRIDLTSSGPGWGGAAFPRLGEVGIDGGVLVFTAAVAVGVGLMVGAGAAVRAAGADVFEAVRAAGAAARPAGSASHARRALVVVQVACAMTLLVGAVLLTRSLQHLVSTDRGYVSEGVLTFQVGLPSARYPDDRLRTFAETLVERVRGLPGVTAAGYANQLPMVQLRDTAGGLWSTPDATRRPTPDGADARFVSRDYLAAMGMRVVAGRGFDERDAGDQPRVLLVNQALVRRQFPDRDPIGVRVFVGRDTTPWTIVGVVADVRQFGLERAPEPQFFADLRQWSGGMPLFPGGAYYVVTARGSLDARVPDLRAIVRALDAEAALFNVAPMAAIVASSVARPRLYATLVGAFALLGTLLAAIGVYGVLAFLVRERTAEIGIRMALGATPAAILRMVLREGGGLVTAGLVLGTGGAVALSRTAESLLYGVRPSQPATYAAAAALFGLVAAIAVLVPARLATRIDPLAAIRCE